MPDIDTIRVILPRTQVIRLSDTEIAPGSGGATAFIALTDVPNSYVGASLKIVRVNAGETGLEFSTGGGGGTPGGSNTQVQYNNSNAFGGITGATSNGTIMTLTSPSITTPTGIVNSDVGLGSVTNDVQTKAAIVPNTAPSSGQILVGNAGGTAYAKQTVSGSGATITLANTGVATISAIANASLSNSSITIAANSTALGGTVTQDQITGLASTGLVKRTAANTLAVVTDTTVGDNLVTLPNPSAITFIRINADNTVDARSASNFRSDIGAGTGSGDALTSNPLSQFVATTSLQLKGVISDETGSGALVFADTPTLIAPLLGTPTSGVMTNVTGTAASLTAGNATKWTTGRTISLTGDVTYTSGSLDGSGNVTGTATLANIPTATPAAGSIIFADIAAPSSPSAAHLAIFGDSTDLRFHDKNAAGTIGTTVVADTGASNNFLTAVSVAGVISKAQPAIANLSDAGTLATWAGVTPASGVTTFLTTPSSANLRSALTDENGTGAALFDSSTSATFITPLLGTPTSGVLSNCTTATQSAGDNSTKLASTAYADTAGSGHAIYVAASPPTVDVGFFTIVKTGVDLKNNATTDLFTVPTSRTFVCVNANIIPTAVTAGAAVAIVWRILESGASGIMTTNTAATSAAPVTTKVWAQIGANTASTSPNNTCAAGNKVQFSLTTGWTTSTTVTGNVYVFGYYST